ncbi:MAG: hypothetical protein JWO11_2761 [Nocardioides sp.]|nr:hypothetical protein [Nocardioides sp.]
MIRVALVVLGLSIALMACGGGDNSAGPLAPVTVTQTVTQPASSSATSDPSGAASTTPTALPSIQVPTVTFPGSPAPSPDPSANVSRPPRTYVQALEHISAAEAESPTFQQSSRWKSPSANIYCVLGSRLMPPSCELVEGAIRDPAVCGPAPTPFVGRLEIRGGRARAICNTDTIRAPGSWPTVDYGTVVGTAKVICLSEDIGVTCISTSRPVGFFVRRGEYVLFNAG